MEAHEFQACLSTSVSPHFKIKNKTKEREESSSPAEHLPSMCEARVQSPAPDKMANECAAYRENPHLVPVSYSCKEERRDFPQAKNSLFKIEAARDIDRGNSKTCPKRGLTEAKT